MRNKLRTGSGPHHAQQSPGLLVQFKLTLGVNHRRLGRAVILSALEGFPRPPGERFSTDEQQGIATGYFYTGVQVEPGVQAGVDGCARYRCVPEHIQGAKVRLGIFL